MCIKRSVNKIFLSFKHSAVYFVIFSAACLDFRTSEITKLNKSLKMSCVAIIHSAVLRIANVIVTRKVGCPYIASFLCL